MGFNYAWIIYLCGRSGWFAGFLGILLTIPFILAILLLSKKYPENNIFDIIYINFGKSIYIIMIIINMIINIALAVVILNLLWGLVKVYFLLLTPVWVIMLINVTMAFLFVNNKPLLFGRTIELLTIWYIINYFTGFSLGFVKEFDLKNIYPIFDTTLIKFGEGVLFSLCSASEIMLSILVMTGNMPQTNDTKKSILKGILLWSLILPLAVFIMQGISGPEIFLRTASVGVEVSRYIYFGDFLRGLELFILATYQLICILKLSIYFYCVWIPIRKILHDKYSFTILLLISLIVLVLSAKLNSVNKAFFISIFMYSYIVLPFTLIVLIIAYLGTLIIKKNKGSDPL